MKRSSLFRIILYIVCAITVLLVILVACLFSVVGHEMYAGMKIDELKPKAQSISQRVTKLYESNTDKRTLARMLHLGEFSASDATIYIIEPNGAVVTTAEQNEYDQSVETVRRCFQTVIQGEEIALPSTDIGIVVGTPVYSDSGDIIGSVILVVVEQAVQRIGHTWRKFDAFLSFRSVVADKYIHAFLRLHLEGEE